MRRGGEIIWKTGRSKANLHRCVEAIFESGSGGIDEVDLSMRVDLSVTTIRLHYRPVLARSPDIRWDGHRYRFDPSKSMSESQRNEVLLAWAKGAEKDPRVLGGAPEWIRDELRRRPEKERSLEEFEEG